MNRKRKRLLHTCFPTNVIEVVNQYITKTRAARQSSNDRQINSSDRPSESATHFYKLPYIGLFSNVAQNRIRQLVNRCCNNLDIKLGFSSFKIRNLFSARPVAGRRAGGLEPPPPPPPPEFLGVKKQCAQKYIIKTN